MMIMSMIAVMICGNGGHGVYALTSKLGGRSGGGRGSFGRGRGGGALQRAALRQEIGRASCRERVCKYVYISVVAASLKKKISTQLIQYMKKKNIRIPNLP